MGIWVTVCVQKLSHYFLQTFCPLRMFKIVFRDSSLYPKQLSLFYLLRLISASVDPIGYITNFCSMIDRATIDLEPKKRTAEENLILLPKKKKLFLFARLMLDHTFAYLSPRTICFSNVLFSTSFLE